MEGDTSKISQCNPEHPLTFEHCKIEYLYLVVDLDNISVNVTSTPSNSILDSPGRASGSSKMDTASPVNASVDSTSLVLTAPLTPTFFVPPTPPAYSMLNSSSLLLCQK